MGCGRVVSCGGHGQELLGQCLDLALDGRGIQLSVGVGEDATRSLAYNSSNIRPSAALPERFVLVAIATEPACLCGNVSPITPD